jgi:TonB family protein
MNPTPAAPSTEPSPTAPEESKPGENGALGTEENAFANSGPMPDTSVPPSPPKLNLTWKSFDAIYGDRAAADRESYAVASLERRRNRGAFGNYSAKVLKAVNNHQSFIKPGEQEPLGTRKAIFHNYIEAIHEASVHPKFADSFLASLPSLSVTDPINNPDLMMVAEFEIFESGSISEIRVVKTSGNMVFDAGAVDSIYRSSPFPEPPKEVLSWNRRVYIRWGFYRNNRKCGVFNVEPYILRAPGGKEEALPVDKFTVQGG